MNTVMLVGRLAQEPEVRTTEKGKEIVRISLAVNRGFKNPDGIYETDFIAKVRRAYLKRLKPREV